MLRTYDLEYVLVTNGDRITGNYTGYLYKNGELIKEFEEIPKNHRGGIKIMRLACASYLRSLGFTSEFTIQHHCIKPGRPEKKNPIEEWSIYELENKTKKDKSR